MHTDVNILLPAREHTIRARAFPCSGYSCIPLVGEEPENSPLPVGFIMSRGSEVTVVTPQADGSNAPLWEHLLEEMNHWHAFPGSLDELPPECWYG